MARNRTPLRYVRDYEPDVTLSNYRSVRVCSPLRPSKGAALAKQPGVCTFAPVGVKFRSAESSCQRKSGRCGTTIPLSACSALPLTYVPAEIVPLLRSWLEHPQRSRPAEVALRYIAQKTS